MKKLFLTILFTLVLSGNIYAKEINLECKFDKYTNFRTDGSYTTDNSENPFSGDIFFKMNVNNKELQKLTQWTLPDEVMQAVKKGKN